MCTDCNNDVGLRLRGRPLLELFFSTSESHLSSTGDGRVYGGFGAAEITFK